MSVREFADLLHDFGPAIANHLWQSTAFAGLAVALAFALRRNQARARYWIWMAASVKFLVPFALVAAAVGSLAPPHVVAPANAVVYTVVDQASEPFFPSTLPVDEVAAAEPPVRWTALALAGVWGVGFCAVLVTWCVRWRRVARVVGSAAPVTEGREFAALERIAVGAGVRRAIRMRASKSALEPGVFGIVRPVLLWPAAISARLADAQLDAVLAHEVCHVRRRDNLTAILHMFVEAVFWFHPMTWWMGARLLAERERACDEAVVALCPQPQVYAESILKVCEFCIESPLACVSGITGADLKRRVVDIMTARVVRRMTLGAKVAIAAAATLALSVPVVLGITKILPLYGEIATPAGALPSMEAATIKPANPEARGRGFRIEGRHIKTINTSLKDLLAYAYDIQSRQMIGLPDWADSDKYEIEGVAPSDQPGDPNWKLMMQKLLADRFGLQFHTGTTEMPVYELHVGKNGPKLGEVKPGPGQGSLYVSPAASGPGVTLHAKGQTMAGLAKVLEGTEFDRPVVDRTGITGKFDFEMTFSSDRMRKGGGAAPPMEDEPNAPPGIFTAIQDQLGLKLEPAKGPAETLVIDKLQKPELDVATGGAMPAQSSRSGVATPDAADDSVGPDFEVAAIRPSDPNDRNYGFQADGHQIFYENERVVDLIAFAYGLRPSQVARAPEWIDKERYDVRGVANQPNQPTTKQQQHMLRKLLAERFQLKLHRDLREMPIYVVTVAKGGPKLARSKSDDYAMDDETTRRHGTEMALQFKHATLSEFALNLAFLVDRPVVDKTSVQGRYDFTLRYTFDEAHSVDPNAPPGLFTAIQEQMGLKLEAVKAPADVVVIDDIEKPTIDGGQATQSAMAARLMPASLSQQTSTRPAFEVATIKPNVSGCCTGTKASTDQIILTNRTLKNLIVIAYGVQPYQVTGPEWMEKVRFDITAKYPANTPYRERWAMLRTLLEDRFRLSTHQDTKQMSGYLLVVANGGFKLKPSEPGEGYTTGGNQGNVWTFNARKADMSVLAWELADDLGEVVVDNTGVSGVYDFNLRWANDANASAEVTDRAPSVFTALQETLGLRLQHGKVQVPMIVVDRVEQAPTEN